MQTPPILQFDDVTYGYVPKIIIYGYLTGMVIIKLGGEEYKVVGNYINPGRFSV